MSARSAASGRRSPARRVSPPAKKSAPARTPKPAARRAAAPERRRTTRVDVLWQLHVEVRSCPTPASVREISASGFSLETTIPFPPGEVHEFRFTVDEGPSATARAKSAHSVLSDSVGGLELYLTGFKFVQPSPESVRAIKAVIGEIQALVTAAGALG